jgi:CO/xanthine dehydrogenase Mo-binding subunit
VIGASPRRREDPRLVRGAGRYVDDLALPDALALAVVRSPHAHARITRVDGAAARDRAGVRGVFTLDDLPELRGALPPPVMNALAVKPYRQSALAGDRARYAGEPVAVVAADSAALAADAAEAVVVEYDPLPVVTDAEHGRRPGAPLVHPEWGTNVAGTIRLETGDVAAAFARADVVVSGRFTCGRMIGLPLEPRAVLARWDAATATLTLWTSTQMPYGVREYVMRALDLPRAAVRVIAPDVGGGFGPKAVVYQEELIASTLARRLGRPVRWTETRRESMLATVHGHDQVHEARLGLRQDGTFLALEDAFVIDNGAYLPRGARTANNVAAHLMGPYRFAAFRCTGDVVTTSKAPNIPFRGAGRLQAVFVTERLVQRASEELGIDPVALRRRNLVRPEELPLARDIDYRPGLPVVYDSGDYPGLLDAVVERLDDGAMREVKARAAREGRRVGCAVAMYTEGTGVPPAEGAMVTVDERGRVAVALGAPSQGQGHETTMAQICADRLGVPLEQVTVVAGDTARFPASPVSSGTFASRVAVIAGSAVALAAEEVRVKAARVAARLLECAEGDVVIEDGVAHVKGLPGRALPLAALAVAAREAEFLGERAEPGLSATRYYAPPAVTWAAGAHAVAVEVCPVTGAVSVLRYCVAHDSGREINPLIVEGQVHGGVAQGLASALLEEIVYDGANQLLTGTLMDYALPRADTFPPVELARVESPSRVNALGLKGAGEGGGIPGQALVANAIADALGVDGAELDTIPIRPERVLALARRATPPPRRTA